MPLITEMVKEKIELGIDPGIYNVAGQHEGRGVSEWLEDYVVETKNFEPTEYYKAGMTTNWDVAVMKSQYRARGEQPPLTAIESVYAAHGIKSSGLLLVGRKE